MITMHATHSSASNPYASDPQPFSHPSDSDCLVVAVLARHEAAFGDVGAGKGKKGKKAKAGGKKGKKK